MLNVESEHEGGMRAILAHLLEFFKAHPGAQGSGAQLLPLAAHVQAGRGGRGMLRCRRAGWREGRVQRCLHSSLTATPLLALAPPPPPPLPVSLPPPPPEFDVCTGKVEDYVFAPAPAK